MRPALWGECVRPEPLPGPPAGPGGQLAPWGRQAVGHFQGQGCPGDEVGGRWSTAGAVGIAGHALEATLMSPALGAAPSASRPPGPTAEPPTLPGRLPNAGRWLSGGGGRRLCAPLPCHRPAPLHPPCGVAWGDAGQSVLAGVGRRGTGRRGRVSPGRRGAGEGGVRARRWVARVVVGCVRARVHAGRWGNNPGRLDVSSAKHQVRHPDRPQDASR